MVLKRPYTLYLAFKISAIWSKSIEKVTKSMDLLSDLFIYSFSQYISSDKMNRLV